MCNPTISSKERRRQWNLIKSIKAQCLNVLKTFDDESVNTVITSPSYWGLRDYGMMGPILDEQSNPLMKDVNYVDFNESSMVDGSIITEVKQDKDGVSIKLAQDESIRQPIIILRPLP
ncbi:hypothetical protein [Psychrobacillus sp. NPDC096389]|uniref:hypothetical protein n=1 Tax=Psychrobacillus sp. NPDC096389 TaxID=3364490 RepID=UPI0038041EE0